MTSSSSGRNQPSLQNVRAGYKTVSQSAVAAVLQDIKENGLPKAHSRSAIKRSRNLEVDIETPYGKLIVTKSLNLSEKYRGRQTWDFHFINPAAFLHAVCERCDNFSTEFSASLSSSPPSLDAPLTICFYADEVTAGNPLANRVARKFQVAYWAICNLGPAAMSCESRWFPLLMARSELVKLLPGRMAQLTTEALLLFRQPWDLRAGLVFTFTSGDRHMVFAEPQVYLADEAALKEIFEFRGASGTKLCPLCVNLVDHRSELHLYSADGGLVPSTCLDRSAVERSTRESIQSILELLEDRKATASKTGFAKLQQFAGWSYNPWSPLLNTDLSIDLPAQIMFDWMHTYCAGGLWGLEVGLLLGQLQTIGYSQTKLHEAIQEFVFPRSIQSRSVSGKQVFSKEQTSDIKAQASEVLSLYSVIRFLLLEKFKKGELEALLAPLDSYLKLCKVLDLLVETRRGSTQGCELRDAVDSHLEAFVACYSTDRFIPKHHYSTHLGDMLHKFKYLIACFCLERKHREFKRWATLSENTPPSWERGVLRDALIGQFQDLKHDAGTACFEEPGHVLKRLLQSVFSNEDIAVSDSASYLPGAMAYISDVVIFSCGDAAAVGQVQFFAKVESTKFVCVKSWRSCGQNLFDNSDPRPVMCPLESIIDTCIHVTRGDRVAIVPRTTRDTSRAGVA